MGHLVCILYFSILYFVFVYSRSEISIRYGGDNIEWLHPVKERNIKDCKTAHVRFSTIDNVNKK